MTTTKTRIPTAELDGVTGYALTSSHPFTRDAPDTFPTMSDAWLFAAEDLYARERDVSDMQTAEDVRLLARDPRHTRVMLADRTTFAVRPTTEDHADWSDGWARRKADRTPELWGAYVTDMGALVRMYRGKRNIVRFYDATGTQHGPEQTNVAPAVAFAHAHNWLPQH